MKKVGVYIRKIYIENRDWLKRRNKKILYRYSNLKIRRKEAGKIEYSRNKAKYRPDIVNKCIIFKTPQNFSIVNNTEETISFYNKLLKKLDEHKFGTNFYIDSSDVLDVTVDAIMFLIAIVRATKFNTVYHYKFWGNFPKDIKTKKIFKECGFLKYVTADKDNIFYTSTYNIQILRGNNVDTARAEEICAFTKECCKINIEEMGHFYPVLIELMGNTTQHAYKDNINKIPRHWYFFAEKRENCVQFVFLDTGAGIPATVYKEIHEKILTKLFSLKKDSEFIRSTLDGSFRTETKKTHRGQGLPQISTCFKSGLFQEVSIFSGRGACYLNALVSTQYGMQDFPEPIFGTLFCWKIIRKGDFT